MSDIFTEVAHEIQQLRTKSVEALVVRAVAAGYEDLALERQHTESGEIVRVLSADRVVARLEISVKDEYITIKPYWLGEDQNSAEDEALRKPT